MLVPLAWLRTFCDPPLDAAAIAARLTMTGTKEERSFRHGPGSTERFVVGRVLAVRAHPDADRLKVCEVDVGERATIVCGAPNVAAGQTVAVALPGALMPDGTELRAAKLRGVKSAGMILAEDELGLSSDHAEIIELDDAVAPGTPLSELFEFSTEVLELEITPNRPDCLGVYGVARELHAATGAPLAAPPWQDDPGSFDGAPAGIEIEVACPDLCPRFAARVFEDVTVGPSPLWLRARLAAAGQRSINNVVDITNYVMLSCAQPLHAFDLDRVAGARLTVRRAGDGEQIETLDGVVRRLDREMVVICDADEPTSIAGVMGGARSEVSSGTRRVLLEAATWIGPNIHRTATLLGLRSEASARFEKGLAPESALEALALATRLFVELCGARVLPGSVDVAQPPAPAAALSLRPARVRELLGSEIDAERCATLLAALGFGVNAREPGELAVTVPHFRRSDVTREIDLIEEVARLDGVERLPATLPPRSGASGRLTHRQRVRRQIEDRLAGRGLSEIAGWSFASPDLLDRLRLAADHPLRRVVTLENPMSAEESIMRPTLLGSLLDAARHNVARGSPDLALFELGTVFGAGDGALPDEHEHVGVLLHGRIAAPAWTGPEAPRASFFVAKALLEGLLEGFGVACSLAPERWPFLHPGRSAQVSTAERRLGTIGELHPLVAAAWDLEPTAVFMLDVAAIAAVAPELRHYAAVPTHPALREDLAVVVADDVAAARVLESVRAAGGELLAAAQIFDVYRGPQVGEGRTSLALHLEFRAPDRTLTDAEAAAARARIGSALRELGGELRA